VPRQPPPFIFVTFNPCNEWPRTWFYEPYKNHTIQAPYYFLPATILDNPFASEDYKESLKLLPPEEYDRFVKGEWDFIDDPRQLIKLEWIWKARSIDFVDGKTKLGVDVARYGNDVVGLGSGVVDYCRHKGLPVQEVVAGAKVIKRPGAFFGFKDLRSQMWWEFREKLRLGQFRLILLNKRGEEEPLPAKLIGDLTNIRYEISGDKVIEVEPKEGDSPKWGVKARLGRSPDDGDALVSAAFEWPDVPRRPVLPGTVIMRGGR
jgi:hypothetical protein